MNKGLLLLVLLSPSLLAQTVYKSVEGGVTTFSDSPPKNGEAEVLEIDVPPPAVDGLAEERLAEMRETTDRMVKDRRDREKYRAQMRESQRSAAAVMTAPTPAPVASWSQGFWPGFGRPIRPRPPFRPGRPISPGRPGAAAPPGWSVMQPGNSQLMRPIVSGRN
jgi:hypothetical protein